MQPQRLRCCSAQRPWGRTPLAEPGPKRPSRRRLTNNGAQSVVPASYAAQALESAQAAIAGSSDALASAWTAKTEADAALTAGQPKRAVPLFSEALELAAPALLQPCHDELGALPTDFEDSLWETAWASCNLPTPSQLEFGTCDDLTLTDGSGRPQAPRAVRDLVFRARRLRAADV